MNAYKFTGKEVHVATYDHMEMATTVLQRVKHARKLTHAAVARMVDKKQSVFTVIIPAVDMTNGPEVVYIGIK